MQASIRGKRFAVTGDGKYLVPDGYYSGTAVTMDGKIATAGLCPYRAGSSSLATTEELTRRFVELLNKSLATP
jgi:hypothetical protein